MTARFSELSTAEKLTIGAGVALGLGAFLPWLTASAPFVGTISRSGISGTTSDGWIAVVLGVVMVLAVINRHPTFTLVTAIGAAIFVGVEYSDITNRISDMRATSGLVIASVGNGIWLMGAASVTAVLASLYTRRDDEAEKFAAQFLPAEGAEATSDRSGS